VSEQQAGLAGGRVLLLRGIDSSPLRVGFTIMRDKTNLFWWSWSWS
jgi:hypothetical protein